MQYSDMNIPGNTEPRRPPTPLAAESGGRCDQTLSRSRERFQHAFVNSTDAVAIIGLADHCYLDVNDRFIAVTGYERTMLIGHRFTDAPLWESDQSALLDVVRTTGPVFDKNITLTDQAGKSWDGTVSAMAMAIDGQPHLLLVIRIADELKRVEAALEKSEGRYMELFNNMSSGVIVLQARDHGNRFAVLDFNHAAERIEQTSREDVIGRDIMIARPTIVESGLFDTFQRVWRSGRAEFHAETITRDKERRIWTENHVYKLPSGEIVMVYDDVSTRKLAEHQLLEYQNQLQSLASELSLVEERERRSIATDLHDHIGQTLSVIKIKIFAAQRHPPDEISPLLDEIGDLVQQTIQDTRSLTFELSPPVLYELGLEAAIEWLADDFRRRHGLMPRVRHDGRPKPMGEDVRIVLFRAVRELLVNTVKHAEATHVRIDSSRDNDMIRIMVEDDGQGFAPQQRHATPGKNYGFGLFNISERLNHLGGRLDIDSQPGHGSRVTLVAPLKQQHHMEVVGHANTGSDR